MAVRIELKYFNTFWIKKNRSLVDASVQPIFNDPTPANAEFLPINYNVSGVTYTLNTSTSWIVEEARIKGGYNNTSVDFGVKAYLVEENPEQQHRFNSIIYSGIFNSRTGVNNTNQFPTGESITKSADPANGSIQKLYAEDTNLIIFQEQKVSRALIDKDAIYSAEGNASITSTQNVVGQIIAYAGEYGISKDPFSFAVYGYRKYFTDRKRTCVLRLSKDGITEISSYGMHDHFRDELSNPTTNEIRGGFDMHIKNYTLNIKQSSGSYNTATFDEDVKGWTSFFSYSPQFMASVGSNFFTLKNGVIYQHYSFDNISNTHGKFYDVVYDSTVKIVLNSGPSVMKVFQTINYEGASGWQLTSMQGSPNDTGYPGDITLPIGPYTSSSSLADLETAVFSNNFKRKENKYFCNLINNSPADPGEIVFGPSMTGIKGFFATVEMKLANVNYQNQGKKELFAVSSETVESSY